MNFQDALTELQNGKRLTRTCWKDKSRYVFIYQPTDIVMLQYMVGHMYRNEQCQVAHYTHMNRPWTPSGEGDIFANDWVLVK